MFHWIFRATRNWDSVSGLLPSMREHASHTISHQKSASESTSKVNLKSDEGEITEDYSTIFRELFCVAADELAGELNEPLENVGVLFDEIFNTGHAAASSSGANWNQFKSALQVEKGNSIVYTPGRGLLFLSPSTEEVQGKHPTKLRSSHSAFYCQSNFVGRGRIASLLR